jgi:hypothetical protein
VEESGGHGEAGEALRLAGTGKLQIGVGVTGQRFERAIPRAEIAKVERVQGEVRVIRAVEEDAHEAGGVG